MTRAERGRRGGSAREAAAAPDRGAAQRFAFSPGHVRRLVRLPYRMPVIGVSQLIVIEKGG